MGHDDPPGLGAAARKAALRAAALAARRQLDAADRARASAAIVQRLSHLPELAGVRTALLYAATAEEPDLAGLIDPLHRRGVRTLFPRVTGDTLELAVVTDPTMLNAGFRGIREPTGSRIDPEVVDLAVIPGVAFDPHGGRIGQGGGHYDRFLPALPGRAVRIGVCFACQVVPTVPLQDHDEVVHLVVTEHAVYRRSEPPNAG